MGRKSKYTLQQVAEWEPFLHGKPLYAVHAFIRAKGKMGQAAKLLGIRPASMSSRMDTARRMAETRGNMPEFGSVHPVPEGMRIKGISSNVDDQGMVKQSWVKLEADRDAGVKVLLDNLEQILENYKGVAGRDAPKQKKGAYDNDTMTWYPIGDHHFGMYAWAEECGEDYDTDMASRLLRQAIDKLVDSAPMSAEAALLNVGDFFHMDNTKNVTNHSGNILDVDTRWTKVIQVGVDALRYAVDRMLEKHYKVHLYNVMGNHDTHSATALSMVMAAIYEGNPRINVHVTANPFQYHQFGQCLVGMHHGDTIKRMDDYVGIMARDQAEKWGATQFRYWWLGHVHHSQRHEKPGVLIETFRTLAARDAWHASMGYGAGRDMTAIVLHKDYGEIERHTVPVQMLRGWYE